MWPRIPGPKPLFYGGTALLLLLLLCVFFGPYLAPHDPAATRLSARLLPLFSPEFPFGTDQLGRCVLSRVICGARITVGVTLTILCFSVCAGLLAGCFAGYAGKGADSLVMLLTDAVMAFPSLILALVVIGFLGPGMDSVILALVLVRWVTYCRVTRNLVLSARERPYVAAARVCGASSPAILRGHIIPKIMPTISVMAMLDFGRIMLTVSALSFLGLGAVPPAVEWGAMLSESRAYMQAAPQLFILPGLCIAIAVACAQCLITAFFPHAMGEKAEPYSGVTI